MNGYGNEEKIIRSRESIEQEIGELDWRQIHARLRKVELENRKVHPYQDGLKCSFLERLNDEIDYCQQRIEVLENMLG